MRAGKNDYERTDRPTCSDSKGTSKKIFLPIWFVRIGFGVLSIFKSSIAFSDQIPRLLCRKDQSIDKTQAIIPYNPRKIEEGLLFFQSKT